MIAIRPAAAKDVLQLSYLFQREIESQQSRAGYYELVADFNWTKYVEDRLNSRKGFILVAESSNVIVGFIYSRIIEYPPQRKSKSIFKYSRSRSEENGSIPVKPMRWGVMEECYVVPSFRRQGIAGLLIKKAITWFNEKKVRRIELSIVASNAESQALARQFGFEIFRLSLSKTL